MNVSAWIFGERNNDHDALSLSIPMQDFGDLWGSLQGLPAENGLGFIRLYTEDGFIQALYPSPHPLFADERACYWCPSSHSTDENSSAASNREDSPSSVCFNVVLPKDAKLLICPNPEPQDEKKQPRTANLLSQPSNIASEGGAKMPTEDYQNQLRRQAKQNLIEHSKSDVESPDAIPGDDPKSSKLVIRTESDPSESNDSGEENSSRKESDNSPSIEGDVAAIEGADLLSIWSKVKQEVIEKLIRDHKPMLAEILGITTCGESQTPKRGRATTSTDGEGSESSSLRRDQKRSRRDDDSSPPDDNQGGRKWSKQRYSGSGSPDRSCRRVACHFYQRNPQMYQNEDACTGPGFESICRLK